MKKILLIITAILFSINSFSQTVNIGTGTSVWSNPFEMSWGYFRYAHVYQSSEIGTTGNINSIGFYIDSLTASAANGPVKIYFKIITNPFIGGETWNDIITGATLVYDNNASFVAGGWQPFSLIAPFNYTSDHLLVLVETNYGGTGSGESFTDKNIRYTDVGAGMNEVWHQDNTPPAGTAAYTTTKRPNIQLVFDQTTAVETNGEPVNENKLTIVPNPANQIFSYSIEGIREAGLYIYAVDGKQVYSGQINASGMGDIDVSSLQKGYYFVKVVNEKINLCSKLAVL